MYDELRQVEAFGPLPLYLRDEQAALTAALLQ